MDKRIDLLHDFTKEFRKNNLARIGSNEIGKAVRGKNRSISVSWQ